MKIPEYKKKHILIISNELQSLISVITFEARPI